MKLPCQVLLVFTMALASGFALVNPVFGQPLQADFNAYSGSAIHSNMINGIIGNEWSDAAYYSNVPISPYGIANIWLKHDATYLYLAMEFCADSTSPWVAIQFGPTYCMSASADAALLGDADFGNYSVNGYVGIHFGESAAVIPDAIQAGGAR